MGVKENKTELFLKYRPADLGAVYGQEGAVAMLDTMVKKKRVPHTVLFAGPSGVGKTTLARILATRVGATEYNVLEVNCAATRGIDMVREIDRIMPVAPMGGKARVWILDEVHRITKDAQSAFLKILEDTPKHVYFFLCTTEPNGLLPTILTRATMVALEAVDRDELAKLLTFVAEAEGIELTEDVEAAILKAADGSARQALNCLNAIRDIEDEEGQIAKVHQADTKREGFEIAKAIFSYRPWSEVATLIKNCKTEPEGVRLMILAWATKVILGGGKNTGRAYDVINAFWRDFYTTKQAGLAAAAYEVVVLSKKK